MIQATISIAQFVREVRRRATELPPPYLDPLAVLVAKAQSRTFEDRTVARAIVGLGLITGRDLDDSAVWALGATSLGWLAEFANRWSIGEYSDAELAELVRLFEQGVSPVETHSAPS